MTVTSITSEEKKFDCIKTLPKCFLGMSMTMNDQVIKPNLTVDIIFILQIGLNSKNPGSENACLFHF
jgi:hypothetical protein